MTTDIKHILIFKTNIQTVTDLQKVEQLLSAGKTVQQWNVDQQDADCVLRIVSAELTHDKVINMINNCGYQCAELE